MKLASLTRNPCSVVFDIGGVLIDWNPRHLYRPLFEGREAEMEWFLKHVCTESWNAQLDAGKPFAHGVRELQARWPGFAPLIAAYDSDWEKMLGEAYQGGVRCLSGLKRLGYPVFALSNFSSEKFPIAQRKFPFLAELDGILISGDAGLIKPDPRIYRYFCQRFRLDPESIIFIDDRIENVRAARKERIKAIHHTAAMAGDDALVSQCRDNGLQLPACL